MIAFHIDIGSKNGGSGFSWISFGSIANLLEWARGKKGDGYVRVSRAVRDLALDGFIVRSPGNERGAHGRVGPSFALTLPDAMTWEACIAAYQADFGGKNAQPHHASDLAATGTARDWSKPNGTAQTDIETCGSQPSVDGTDRHQKMPVETTRDLDRHENTPVHLTLNGVAGRGDAALGSGRSEIDGTVREVQQKDQMPEQLI